MLSRARYCWPGSNYPVTLHDCSPGPPPGAASAAEASPPVPRSPRASFLSEIRPVPRSRPPLSRFAASDMGLSSWAYAADYGAFVEKSSLRNLRKPWFILLSQKHLILHDLYKAPPDACACNRNPLHVPDEARLALDVVDLSSAECFAPQSLRALGDGLLH